MTSVATQHKSADSAALIAECRVAAVLILHVHEALIEIIPDTEVTQITDITQIVSDEISQACLMSETSLHLARSIGRVNMSVVIILFIT